MVHQDKQLMYVYEEGVRVRSIPVSTGAPTSKTFTPSWQGQVGAAWGSGYFVESNLRADYIWYLFPGPEGSILIHSAPYYLEEETKKYDRLDALGVEPASRGCIRLSPADAAWLQTWDPVGVPITISRWSGPISPATEALKVD